MSREHDERPPLKRGVKTRPQITTDPTTYALAQSIAREDGGSVANLVRTLIRRSALEYYKVTTVREALKAAQELGAVETRGGGA